MLYPAASCASVLFPLESTQSTYSWSNKALLPKQMQFRNNLKMHFSNTGLEVFSVWHSAASELSHLLFAPGHWLRAPLEIKDIGIFRAYEYKSSRRQACPEGGTISREETQEEILEMSLICGTGKAANPKGQTLKSLASTSSCKQRTHICKSVLFSAAHRNVSCACPHWNKEAQLESEYLYSVTSTSPFAKNPLLPQHLPWSQPWQQRRWFLQKRCIV